MGKNGELWDDSALVKAFDDAISKYKGMHGKGGNDDLLERVRVAKDIEESSPIVVDEHNEAKSVYVETDDDTSDVLKNTTIPKEAMDSSLIEKCPSEVNEQYPIPANHEQVPDNTHLNAQYTEDYNHLLNQYNAVEEQRQKLLEQLYQFGNWDYQGYGYGASYASQEQHVPTAEAPCPSTICSCRSYVCPYPTATCSSLAQNESSVSLKDGGLIKAAMGAVDRAISSFKTEASCIPELDKEQKRDEEVETGARNVGQDKTPETDLSVVLNAWFSAGFYTGKYLSEQASAKK